MIGKLLRPEINELISARDFETLKNVFSTWQPIELADLIIDIPENDRAVVFRILPRKLSAETFEYLDIDIQKSLLKALGKEEVANILNEMAPDSRTAFFEELPGAVVRQLLSLLSSEERAIAQSLLGYPENSVGRLMTPDYITIKPDWTVKDVFDYVRVNGQDSETLNILYVVDENGKLIDDLKIREFLLSPLERKVQDMIDNSFVSLSATDTQENAVSLFKKYDRVALPVVDSDGLLIGIVTVDDVLDVMEESNTEDVQKFGGLEALDYPYKSTPILEMIKKRAGWLIILFLSEMLTATAMGHFEDEIAKAVVLAIFVPLIISSGGNSGSQAATLIIRALALGEIKLRDWWYIMKREFISGLLLGSILGSIGFLRITIWSLFTPIYGPHWLLIAITVAFSLIGVVLWGTFAGSMLPIVLKRLGLDPATSSAPFVATLVDVTGLIIYFTIAAIILRGTLL